jgi:outer membrane lipoprotein carrier protein
MFTGQVTAEPSDSDALVLLRDYLVQLNSLRAQFSQEIIVGDDELVEAALGRVSLKKPGKFRWDYTEPFERVIVADGERVWLYEADLEQVTVRPLDRTLGETPAALLSGDAKALDRFELIDASASDHLEWVQLRPVSQESDFERIRLAFEAGELTELTLEDRLGQTTRIFLSDVATNVAIADEVFRFQVPDGVDVIGEGDL